LGLYGFCVVYGIIFLICRTEAVTPPDVRRCVLLCERRERKNASR